MTQPSTHDFDPLSELLLDPKNPRLRRDEEGQSQEQLLEIMVRRFKIAELAESIVASGYLPFDPMIAYRDDASVYVREGNRRLAAIKLLLDPDLAPARTLPTWQELSVRLSGETREQLTQLSVTVYDSADAIELSAYIGFRHVTGVLQWPPLEKAGFIALLIEQGLAYAEIAERLGSYPRHVERHYIAHQLVQQAVEREVPGHEKIEDSFGVLLRALQASGIAEFIGVAYPGDPGASGAPVPDDHFDAFRDFVRWTFGTDEFQRVLPDSRRLTDWGAILQSTEAVQYLRLTPEPSFDRAWLKAGGQAESVRDGLWTAAYRLEEVVPLVVQHTGDEQVEDAVRQCALFFGQVLGHFPDVSAEFRAAQGDGATPAGD
jgi:hypothetical protein